MAHGSKKWIVAFDGTIKRSNDRTKKDYYRDLKDWDEYYSYHRWSRYGRSRKMAGGKFFCPQCKHVRKDIVNQEDERRIYYDALHEEYDQMYGDAQREWTEYHRKVNQGEYVTDHLGKIHWKDVYVVRPKVPEPPTFYDWKKSQREETPSWWNYDARSYLCYKHEHWYEVKQGRQFWKDNYPRKYTYARRREYQNYRNETRNLMARAKYDEQYYDDIVPKKNGWLD